MLAGVGCLHLGSSERETTGYYVTAFAVMWPIGGLNNEEDNVEWFEEIYQSSEICQLPSQSELLYISFPS